MWRKLILPATSGCNQRKALRLAIFIFSLHQVLLKWLIAVLFTKTFSKLTAANREGVNEDIFLQTENDFWRFIFLVELTFEEVIGLAVACAFILCATEVWSFYMAHILAEKKRNERRNQVVWAATNGSAIVGGKADTRTTNEVVLMTEIISLLQEHELDKQRIWTSTYDRIFIAFIFGLILVPVLSLIVIALFAFVTFMSFLGEKVYLVENAATLNEKSAAASLRILDIVRAADVIAVSDTAQLEQSSVEADGALLLNLQRNYVKYLSMIKFNSTLLTTLVLPLVLAVIYYAYEVVGDDPLETTFSTLAFVVILEEVHKSMLFQSNDKENLRKYHENKLLLKQWLDDRGISDREDDGETIYNGSDTSVDHTSFDDSDDSNYHVSTATFANVSYDVPSSSLVLGDIVLENVSIGYGSQPSFEEAELAHDKSTTSRLILQNKNIAFPFRKRTALVGESGSGKSSILKVISGLLLPVQGNVSFGNLSIVPKNFSKLRQRMGYCSQESLLFARSIRDNVWYGHRDPVDDVVILSLLQSVGLGEWISNQPNGLDQKLDLGEGNVSGGQAQRLQLARLLSRDYVDLVLLDEACSALDNENRQNVLKCMKKFLRNKTCIWITHHLDVLEEMDEVVNISNI